MSKVLHREKRSGRYFLGEMAYLDGKQEEALEEGFAKSQCVLTRNIDKTRKELMEATQSK